MSERELEAYLEQSRQVALDEIRALIPRDEVARRALYDLVLDYPLRDAKGLRPALCVAACRAHGGALEAIAPSAGVLELYHNAFLIHDDIEDESELRRGRPTLHLEHGVPIAVNVGDAMLALALQPLLDNARLLGLGRSLRILQSIAHMVTMSVEGQALELEWIARRRWDLSDEDYYGMVVKKTGWYSFITPLLVGAVAAGAPAQNLEPLAEFGRCLGVAFQIQDDVLNLEPAGGAYGKEANGDLWEGKRTLILLHCLRSATADERSAAEAALAKARPNFRAADAAASGLGACIQRLVDEGELSPKGRSILIAELGHGKAVQSKAEADIHTLLGLIRKYGSVDYARACGRRWLEQAHNALQAWSAELEDSQHLRFLFGVMEYVAARAR